MRVAMVVSLGLALSAAGASYGATVTFDAKLSGRAEAPPTAAVGQGQLTATLDTETRVLTYKVTYAGLTGPATAADFHGPAKAGKNAPPLVTVSDAASPISGHATLTAEQVAALEKGLWYFEVRTAANSGGEIRGQVKRFIDPSTAETAPGTGPDLTNLYRPPPSLSNQ